MSGNTSAENKPLSILGDVSPYFPGRNSFIALGDWDSGVYEQYTLDYTMTDPHSYTCANCPLSDPALSSYEPNSQNVVLHKMPNDQIAMVLVRPDGNNSTLFEIAIYRYQPSTGWKSQTPIVAHSLTEVRRLEVDSSPGSLLRIAWSENAAIKFAREVFNDNYFIIDVLDAASDFTVDPRFSLVTNTSDVSRIVWRQEENSTVYIAEQQELSP